MIFNKKKAGMTVPQLKSKHKKAPPVKVGLLKSVLPDLFERGLRGGETGNRYTRR